MDPGGDLDFASFYAQHAPLVRRMLARGGVRGADLDDVLQETFVTVHRLLPEFEGRSSLQTWLHAIAWRVASTYRRRVRSNAEIPVDPAEPSLASPSSPPPYEPELHTFWSAADADHRDLLVLHEIGGLTISQLAELTGRARATVRMRLERSRTQIARAAGRASTAPSQLARRDAEPETVVTPHVPYLEVLPGGETCFSSVDDILYALWVGGSITEGLSALFDTMGAMVAAHPQGFRYLNVIGDGAGIPSREAREINGKLARCFGPHMTAIAIVVESPALRLLVPPVLNSYIFLSGVPLNIRFFNHVDAALSWLAPSGSTPRARIAAHLAAMRALLGPRCPDKEDRSS